MQTTNRLNKAYTKRFKRLNKNTLTTKDYGLIVFIEYLKYLRDTNIISQKPANIIVTLNVAIEEFEMYRKTQKDFHWNNFCECIKLNMKEWLVANDSV